MRVPSASRAHQGSQVRHCFALPPFACLNKLTLTLKKRNLLKSKSEEPSTRPKARSFPEVPKAAILKRHGHPSNIASSAFDNGKNASQLTLTLNNQINCRKVSHDDDEEPLGGIQCLLRYRTQSTAARDSVLLRCLCVITESTIVFGADMPKAMSPFGIARY